MENIDEIVNKYAQDDARPTVEQEQQQGFDSHEDLRNYFNETVRHVKQLEK